LSAAADRSVGEVQVAGRGGDVGVNQEALDDVDVDPSARRLVA